MISDLNWIIILFVIHLDAFGVEKVEESAHRTIFTSGTSLAKRDLKLSESVLRHQTTFFGGKTFILNCNTFSCYSTHRELSNGIRIASIKLYMQKLCHSEVDLPVFTPIVREDAASAPIIHGKGASHMFVI